MRPVILVSLHLLLGEIAMNMLLALSIVIFIVAIVYKIFKLEQHGIQKVRSFLYQNNQDGKEMPLVIGHRAGQFEAPENTLIAIKTARKNGASAVELDLAFTEDGYAVIIHDDTVDRTTNGSGEVSSKRFYEIRQLDASYRMKTLRYESGKSEVVDFEQIPTLKEVVVLCKDLGMKIILDVKSDAVAVSHCYTYLFYENAVYKKLVQNVKKGS